MHPLMPAQHRAQASRSGQHAKAQRTQWTCMASRGQETHRLLVVSPPAPPVDKLPASYRGRACEGWHLLI